MAQGLYIGLTRNYMYSVYAVYTEDPEWCVGRYETQEEAEEVAQDVLEEYSDEVDHVEVRDKWSEVVARVGIGAL
jgi:predicted RNase H-like HicB family nuclease